MFDLIVVGGGAAGFFGAIQAALAKPSLKIAILERGKTVLGKVKVSGGGRCNLTHAAFDPKELIKNYPRGEKELLGPFFQYAPEDVIQFFEDRSVPIKVEEDGRMFPVSDSSQTIIDCLVAETQKLGITVLKNCAVKTMEPSSKITDGWQLGCVNKTYHAQKIMVTTGSNPKIWALLQQLGHTIVDPLPSLFTFNCQDSRIKGLQGLSTQAHVSVLPKTAYGSQIAVALKSKVDKAPIFEEEGPLLITHWGFSGPAVLRLSAWGARYLNGCHYNFMISVNWKPDFNLGTMNGYLAELKFAEAKKTVLKSKALELPNRLWVRLVKAAGISPDLKWADVNKEQLSQLAQQLTACTFKIEGKSTFKEEFVTAGGVDLKEINFKNFQSKIHPNLYFAGEVINVDAITGGFNFQNAWTGAYLAAQGIAQ